MGDINQDDIDKLLAGSFEDDDDPSAPAEFAPSEMSGPASQDDIDALFAAAGNDSDAAADTSHTSETPVGAAPKPVPETDTSIVPPEDETTSSTETQEMDISGVANQDDIDAMFAAVGDDLPPIEDSPGAPDETAGNVASAFFDEAPSAPEENENHWDNDLADMISAAAEANPAVSATPADTEEDFSSTEADIAALLDSITDERMASASTGTEDETAADENEFDTTVVNDLDMEELLRQVSDAAPPVPPSQCKAAQSPEFTLVMTPGDSLELAQAQAAISTEPPPAPSERPAPAAPPPASEPALPPMPETSAARPFVSAPPAGARKEYSVLYGAGEVESVASQIGVLLTSMSEKAHSYMQAWIAADSEAKELRSRALAEERRRVSLQSERDALATQANELRSRLSELEGGKVASEESLRTLDTTYQAKLRELENRIKLLSSETETLKNELVRARNQATGIDIESRRARFEVDRLKSEVESERMERLRIQRALENREKELQAMQSQASGQASSLFIDELHRLVRRLESELEAKSSGAHDALKQLDRLEVSEDQVPVIANLRAALMTALGRDDPDDALKSLGREAAGIKGPEGVAPGKAEMISYESALSSYNLLQAVDVASALLREASATPATLMRKVYRNPALRRPEVAEHLDALARLLEGLRTVQEANDRARGMESTEAEIFYVHMFDFLHNLVRLKLINRLSGDIWRLFLDLRGRFSFVASDKQWAEYRDKILNAAK